MSQQAELLDLPDEQQKPRVKILTPKIIILSILAMYFVGQNVYHTMTTPQQKVVQSPVVEKETDGWKQSWEMFLKFQHYFYVSVIGFVIFYFLRRANDKHDEELYEKKMKEEKEQEEEERKKQSEREQRIIRQIQREEREAEERQFQMAASEKQKGAAQSPKDGQKSKED